MSAHYFRIVFWLALPVIFGCSGLISSTGSSVDLNKYVVRAGDTVESIAFRYRLDPRKLRSINNLTGGGALVPGLRLSVVEHARLKSQEVSNRVKSGIRTTNYSPQANNRVKEIVVPVLSNVEPKELILESVEVAPVRVKSVGSRVGVKENAITGSGWVWPANGVVTRGYKPREINRQGLDIKGRRGEEIFAAADGTVVYSGQDLASHGKLVILRHSDNVLSAYSSADELFVQEEEVVRAGDSIASMGERNGQGSRLHFEIRKDGKPVDPLRYLPKR